MDATFELSSVPVYELVYHHKAGARGSARSVNVDYHEGLELLLARMATVGVSILGISVDSSVARELDPAERELNLPFPITVDGSTDVATLRLDITRAQKTVARRPDAKSGGGNDQKKIRITLACDDRLNHFDRLRRFLIAETLRTSTEVDAGEAKMIHHFDH